MYRKLFFYLLPHNLIYEFIVWATTLVFCSCSFSHLLTSLSDLGTSMKEK